MAPSLTGYRALSFDVYATLIDWESGIYNALTSLNEHLEDGRPAKNNRRTLLTLFTQHEGRIQRANPTMKYTTLLGETYAAIASDLGVSLGDAGQIAKAKAAFGASVGDWPAFPDTVDALQRLAKHYKLIVLSNVDMDAFSQTLAKGLKGVHFDAIYTAEDIGSYKPDPRNFEYLVQHTQQSFGISRSEILHTAQALFHDHCPAKKARLASAWIIRRGDESVIGGTEEQYKDEIDLSFRFATMGEMADAADEAFGVQRG